MGEKRLLKKLRDRYPQVIPSYFTKYLPIEGEIQKDDKFLFKNNIYIANSIEGSNKNPAEWWIDFEMNGKITCILHNEAKKVKLFLCSRDIQVGDKSQSNSNSPSPYWNLESENDVKIAKERGFFKIIGEISSDALSYVKEGQEFEETEVWYWPLKGGTVQSYKIKGPCGHFH